MFYSDVTSMLKALQGKKEVKLHIRFFCKDHITAEKKNQVILTL